MFFGSIAIKEEDGNYVFRVSCSGYAKDDLKIKLGSKETIIVTGENEEFGKFEESYYVDILDMVDTDNMTAVVKNGIIKFILPKKKKYSKNIKIV